MTGGAVILEVDRFHVGAGDVRRPQFARFGSPAFLLALGEISRVALPGGIGQGVLRLLPYARQLIYILGRVAVAAAQGNRCCEILVAILDCLLDGRWPGGSVSHVLEREG